MHVVDAGNSGNAETPFAAKMRCKTCGGETWLMFSRQSEIRRGVACPTCNQNACGEQP